MEVRRLPLEKLKNCRDLGGFATKNGGATRFGVYLRTEVPSGLPQSDVDFLHAYGVKTVLDFRGEAETTVYPSSLKGLSWLDYRWTPMFTHQVAPQALKQGRRPAFKFENWELHYRDMADNFKPWVKTVVTAAAECEGAMLYNCTTGKDRTGILTALLLSIAGVDRADIIADYCVSMVYLHEVYANLGFPADLPQDFYETPPAAMRGLLSHFDEKYGGAEAYLAACGVENATLKAIRDKFIAY